MLKNLKCVHEELGNTTGWSECIRPCADTNSQVSFLHCKVFLKPHIGVTFHEKLVDEFQKAFEKRFCADLLVLTSQSAFRGSNIYLFTLHFSCLYGLF